MCSHCGGFPSHPQCEAVSSLIMAIVAVDYNEVIVLHNVHMTHSSTPTVIIGNAMVTP